ncbi:MAG: hypothetical protein JWQ40_2746 [Segetibacter sp.]|jgi:exosortase/archaeosortase family protein|nr:hypothetical protein [Segetibacter sp.]
MNLRKELPDRKSPFLFLIKFLLSFALLYYFFPFYRGITGPGGTFYSSFLDTYLNLVKGLTTFLTSTSKFLLEAFHYTVNQKNYHTIRIDHSNGISVNPSCLGWGVMSFWVAFVFANSGTWKHKFKWMSFGIVSIMILNITRITLIALANHHKWKTITSLDHHQTFNVFSYGCIFLLIYWYISLQKKYEGSVNSNASQEKHALRPI